MIGPTNWEDIGWVGNKISPAGFVLDGDMLIEVQAFNISTQQWDTVATTRSRNGSFAWDGYDWHYWQSPQIQLGYDYWSIWRLGPGDDPYEDDESQNWANAKLRALADGAPIYTFDDWKLGPLRDMVSEFHGKELYIQGYSRSIH